MKLLLRKDEPNFNRLRSAFTCQEPDRVPAMEIYIADNIKTGFMGRQIKSLEDEVDFWMSAGYDSVTLNAWMFERGEGPEFAMVTDSQGERQFSPAVKGLIRTWKDYENYKWDQENVDLGDFKDAGKFLPSEVKTIAYGFKIFMATWMMMGFDHFCMMIVENEKLVAKLMRRYGEIAVETAKRLTQIDTVGALWVGDDFAYQTATMINPDFMRKYLFPSYKKICQVAHDGDLFVIFHSDGNITKVLPDLIDCGFDCIHPFEPGAMDIFQAKKQYKSEICVSGNIDLDNVLSKGSPDKVAADVKRLIRELAPGGGYVLSSSNSMTDYVPLENFVAVMKTLHEAGKYPISC